ncbi:MAG: glycosyltransferase [Calditrichia bacterium]
MKTERIVIVSPVRNEEEYLPAMIESMAKQSHKPVEWLLVDDGSTDSTPDICAKAAEIYSWISYVRKPDRGERSVGPGVVEAFYYGFERLQAIDWDYLCKMDGDLELRPRYFETLLGYFKKDALLGAASGKVILFEDGKEVEERTSDEMVVGAMNFYRRQCFEDIGGFVREVMWDGIAFHRARIAGWRTRSIRHNDLNFLHKRLMGSSHRSIYHGRMRWGRGQYFMGTHPLYLLAIGCYRMLERPYILGGLCIVGGYLKAMFQGMKRYGDNEFRQSLHAWQMERLHLGKRLEKLPPPVQGLYS